LTSWQEGANISADDIATDGIATVELLGTRDKMTDKILKHLPLTEPTYYILLALAEPLHGYAVMQKVEQLSHGAVIVGPGTLYGAFSTLERDGLIVKVAEVERRKSYALTALGRQVLLAQIGRLQVMVRRGGEVAARLKATGTR
jgi:DNA-binding PadR family transcriptional regulator